MRISKTCRDAARSSSPGPLDFRRAPDRRVRAPARKRKPLRSVTPRSSSPADDIGIGADGASGAGGAPKERGPVPRRPGERHCSIFASQYKRSAAPPASDRLSRPLKAGPLRARFWVGSAAHERLLSVVSRLRLSGPPLGRRWSGFGEAKGKRDRRMGVARLHHGHRGHLLSAR